MRSRSVFTTVFFSLLAASSWAQTTCNQNDTAFNSQEGGCKDLTSGLVWGAESPGKHTYDAALADAASLVQAGYSDWRLPSITEMQSAYANGAATRIHSYAGSVYWSSTIQSNKRWAWAFIVSAGESLLVLARDKSRPNAVSKLYYIPVREGSSSLSSSSGGKVGHSASQVTHVLRPGIWTASVTLPEHGGSTYCMMVMSELSPSAQRVPVVRAGTRAPISLGNVPFLAAVGTIDALGRARLSVDLSARGLPPLAAANLTMVLVISDAKGGPPAIFRIRLPR